MNTLLDSFHQRKLLKKWAPLLEAGAPIQSDSVKIALAQVLENTRNDYARRGLISEAVTGVTQAGIMGKGPIDGADSKGVMKGKFGVAGAVNPTVQGGDPAADNYLPNVVMPILRRIFPDLIANELVGVQPLNGPIGFAFALRAKYGVHGQFNPEAAAPAEEIGFSPTRTAFTGAEGKDPTQPAELSSEALADAWARYKGESPWGGTAVDLGVAEYAATGENYPQVSFDLIKSGVEAKTRKLGAHWSPELAEDMEAMHGVDVEAEMVNILSYEIGAEIDRQIVDEMVKAAITGGNVTAWDPATADGLDQMGRLATLLTQITVESNQIAVRTRRGHANFVITSPKVCSLLEQLSMNKFVSFARSNSLPSVPAADVGALQKQGLINDGQQLLVRDAYATGDYVLMGYKGTHPADSGIIYCPYIPVQLSKVLMPNTFTPAIGARTRYGVMNTPWDAGRYYTFMKINGLNNSYESFGQNRYFIGEGVTKGIDWTAPQA